MMTLSSDKELRKYSISIEYRIQSLCYQCSLLKMIILSAIQGIQKNLFNKHDKLEQNNKMMLLHSHINTMLDNIIFHILSLIEYVLTFTSHFCFKEIINDWRKYYNFANQDKELSFLIPCTRKYNKSIIALKDFRNYLIHKNINGFPFRYTLHFKQFSFSLTIGINSEIEAMCNNLIFKKLVGFFYFNYIKFFFGNKFY